MDDAAIQVALKWVDQATGPMNQSLNGINSKLDSVGGSVEGLAGSFTNLGNIIKRAFEFVGVYEAIRMVTSELRQMIDTAIEFDKQMETSRISLASSFMMNLDFKDQFGNAVTNVQALNAALGMSDQMIQKLKYDNLQTTATFQDLLKAFTAALPAGLHLGMSADQVEQVTLRMMQVAGAQGWNTDMMGAELRELLRGQVRVTSPLSAIFSTEDIKQARGDAQAMYDLIMKTTAAFAATGPMVQNTLGGLWSNLKSIFSEGAGEGLADSLFEPLKAEAKSWISQIATIDEQTKTINFNPDFLQAFHNIGVLAMDAVKAIESIGSAALKVSSMLGAVAESAGNYIQAIRSGFAASSRASDALGSSNPDEVAAMALGGQLNLSSLEQQINARESLLDNYEAKLKKLSSDQPAPWMVLFNQMSRDLDQSQINRLQEEIDLLQQLIDKLDPAAKAIKNFNAEAISSQALTLISGFNTRDLAPKWQPAIPQPETFAGPDFKSMAEDVETATMPLKSMDDLFKDMDLSVDNFSKSMGMSLTAWPKEQAYDIQQFIKDVKENQQLTINVAMAGDALSKIVGLRAQLQALQEGKPSSVASKIGRQAEDLDKLNKAMAALNEKFPQGGKEYESIKGQLQYDYGLRQQEDKLQTQISQYSASHRSRSVIDVDQARVQIQRVEAEFRKMWSDLANDQYDFWELSAQNAGHLYQAEELKISQGLDDTMAHIAQETARAQNDIARLQVKLNTRNMTPDARAAIEAEISKDRELFQIDQKRADMAKQTAAIRMQMLDKEKLAGQVELSQTISDLAKLTGNTRQQYQAQETLLRATEAQRLANVNLDIPGLADAYKALYDEQIRLAELWERDDLKGFAAGFNQELTDISRNMDTMAMIGEKTADALKDSLGQFFTDLVSGTKTLSQAWTDLESNILSSVGKIFADRAISELFGLARNGLNYFSGGDSNSLFGKIAGSLTGLMSKSMNTANMNVNAANVVISSGAVNDLFGAVGGSGGVFGWMGSLFSGVGDPVATVFGGDATLASSLIGGQWYGAFADGGIANGPSIFGEAGPEAAVPLPDGRRIPVDLRGGSTGPQPVNLNVTVITNDPNTQVKFTPSRAQQQAYAVNYARRGMRSV